MGEITAMATIASATARFHACDHSKHWRTPPLTGYSPYLRIVQQILTLQVACFRGNQERNLKEIEEGGELKYEVLFCGSQPVGVVVYQKGYIFKVQNLEVREDDLCHAALLIDRVKGLAQRNYSARIELTLSGEPKKIIGLLQKKDFGAQSVLKNIYKPGVNEIIFGHKVTREEVESLLVEVREETSAPESRFPEKSKAKRKKGSELEEEEGSAGPPSKKRGTETDYQKDREASNFDPREERRARRERVASQSMSHEPPTPKLALYRTNLKQKDIDQIKSGEKTIEVKIECGVFLKYKPGDLVQFSDKKAQADGVLCTIVSIRKYPSFEELFQQEDFKKCLPDAQSLEDAVSVYHAIPGSVKKAVRFGVIAIEFRKKPA